jgi:flagellar hook-associated protein 2
VLEAVSSAIGDSSAARAGLQLTRDGALRFDSDTFLAKLKSDPTLVQRLVDGVPETTAPDGTAVAATQGVAQRLFALAEKATDTTTGTLTLLAKSRDTMVTDLQDRIEDWDLRLAARRTTLERQFSGMESALGRLQSQSSWLSSQLSSLPRWSSSDS